MRVASGCALAVVVALAGCGGSGARATSKAANCLTKLGWHVEHVSTKELRATRLRSDETVTWRPPAEPLYVFATANPPTYNTYAEKVALCFPQTKRP